MRRGAAAIDRVEDVLTGTIVAVKEADKPQTTALRLNSKIEFKNVTFKYNDVTILDNISLTIEKGKNSCLGRLFRRR